MASARDPGDITTSIDNKDTANGQHLCGTAKELQHDITDNPAVDFNEAKCAEEDAHPEEAARLLGEYLRLAPKALDAAAVEGRRQQLILTGRFAGGSGEGCPPALRHRRPLPRLSAL